MAYIGCIVLDAGYSTRLGEEKALLETGEGPLVGWLVNRLQIQWLEQVVVTN